MRKGLAVLFCGMVLMLGRSGFAASGPTVLFDAAHGQLFGNADWVLDADGCGNIPRFPTPPQSGISASTDESYWTGAYSAFGVALAKAGYQLESLPPGSLFTYGDAANPQDLTHYKVVVIPEPNLRFSTDEKAALQSFVQNGGGLYMIADHSGSDRNNDGWDSPPIFNDLMMGTAWGLHFQQAREANNQITDDPNANYTTDTTSPIIYTGPFGAARSGMGLSLHGATTLTLDPGLNPTVTGHVWMTSGTAMSFSKVTVATALSGSGRIGAIVDSGPDEDATNGCGDKTYDDFTLPDRDNATITLNIVAWLASDDTKDTVPPTSPTGLVATTVSSSQIDLSFGAATDNVGVVGYNIYISTDGTTFSALASTPDTDYQSAGLMPETTYYYQVTALDQAGNESVPSAIASATTSGFGKIIINEILANEPGKNRAAQFVELCNVGAGPVDLSGWTLRDAARVRHTFAPGTQLLPNKAIVVFGAASAIPPALDNAVAASTGTLALDENTDTVTIASPEAVADTFTYTRLLTLFDGISMNRSPDRQPGGDFVLHKRLSTLMSSPGRHADGTAF